MKKLGFILASMLSANLCAMPLANAHSINISNQSNYTLSFDVNGQCSSDFGTVYPYTIKSIEKSSYQNACKGSEDNCVVNIHDKALCGGELIATVSYDFTKHSVGLVGYGGHKMSVGVSAFYNLFLTEAINQA